MNVNRRQVMVAAATSAAVSALPLQAAAQQMLPSNLRPFHVQGIDGGNTDRYLENDTQQQVVRNIVSKLTTPDPHNLYNRDALLHAFKAHTGRDFTEEEAAAFRPFCTADIPPSA